MIKTSDFYNFLKENGITFYSGVPDSLLKDICAYITDNVSQGDHIITANEGAAVALASGYHLATGKTPLIYMQNSGLGNAINPLLSLADKKVYGIPMILMIGWRGEPGFKDEPQHITQGEITLELLDTMKIPYVILPDNFNEASSVIKKSINLIKVNSIPMAFIIRKNTFEPYVLKNKIVTNFEMNREEAIRVMVDALDRQDIVVSTTGKTSRELFEYRVKLKNGHNNDFLTVGSMGHSSQIALGIAMQKPGKQVFCFDGDGAVLMHAGSLGINGAISPKNFKHIVLNNGSHDSVGGQPTVGFDISFDNLAKVFNYKETYCATNIAELKDKIIDLKKSTGPSLLEVKINKGARKDLGRPTNSPIENKLAFMKYLNE